MLASMAIAVPVRAQQTFVSGDERSHAGIEMEVDTTLAGRDIFSALPENTLIRQSQQVRRALYDRVASKDSTEFSGFRIRIYLGSRPTSREESLRALDRFNSKYPYIQAYRSYTTPNFKVSVGNFRTRTDAEFLLNLIKGDFPEAFIVRERFKYPSIGSPDLRNVVEARDSVFFDSWYTDADYIQDDIPYNDTEI